MTQFCCLDLARIALSGGYRFKPSLSIRCTVGRNWTRGTATLNALLYAHARRVVAAFEEEDTGLVVIDGRSIGRAVLRKLYRVLAIADHVRL